MCILKGVQGQCKPVLAGDFPKSPAKVQLFAHTAKQNAQKQHVCAQNMRFVQKNTVHSENISMNSI